jgi:anti-anti-sigma factor
MSAADRVTIENGRALLAPPALLDYYNAGIFRGYLAAAFAQSATGDIVVMMGAVELCDRYGLACLTAAAKRARELHAAVYLLRLPPKVIEALAGAGILQHFRLIESLGELAPNAASEVAGV